MRHYTFTLSAGLVLLVVGCANDGQVDQGGQTGRVGKIKTAGELIAKMETDKVLLIHAFDAENYAQGHIPGSVNVDFEKMTESMLPGDKDQLLVFYCAGGMCPVGDMASQKAASWGYRKVWTYSGGMSDWKSAGKSLVTGSR
jgi:rhodanese-related sulfurtransferase